MKEKNVGRTYNERYKSYLNEKYSQYVHAMKDFYISAQKLEESCKHDIEKIRFNRLLEKLNLNDSIVQKNKNLELVNENFLAQKTTNKKDFFEQFLNSVNSTCILYQNEKNDTSMSLFNPAILNIGDDCLELTAKNTSGQISLVAFHKDDKIAERFAKNFLKVCEKKTDCINSLNNIKKLDNKGRLNNEETIQELIDDLTDQELMSERKNSKYDSKIDTIKLYAKAFSSAKLLSPIAPILIMDKIIDIDTNIDFLYHPGRITMDNDSCVFLEDSQNNVRYSYKRGIDKGFIEIEKLKSYFSEKNLQDKFKNIKIAYEKLFTYTKSVNKEIEIKDIKYFYEFIKNKSVNCINIDLSSKLNKENDLKIENYINENFFMLKGVCKEITVKKTADGKNREFDQLPKELIGHIASYLDCTQELLVKENPETKITGDISDYGDSLCE